MDNQIQLADLYQIIGQKDVLIFKLEQQVQSLQNQLNEDKGTETKRSGNGKADPRETLQQGI